MHHSVDVTRYDCMHSSIRTSPYTTLCSILPSFLFKYVTSMNIFLCCQYYTPRCFVLLITKEMYEYFGSCATLCAETHGEETNRSLISLFGSPKPHSNESPLFPLAPISLARGEVAHAIGYMLTIHPLLATSHRGICDSFETI